jgi:hypothetical protein
MNHTPGPWRFCMAEVSSYGPDAAWRICAPGQEGEYDALFGSEPYYPWNSSNIADWHLIAAAPELLEALKRLLEAANYRDAASIADPDQVDAAVSMFMRADREARAAIAKAEGK